MSLTQSEIMVTLGLDGKSAARAIVDFSKMELDETRTLALFRQFAGDDATTPPARILSTVVAYLVHDAANGAPLDVAAAIDRAAALASRLPYGYSDAAAAERDAAKAAERAAKVVKAEAAKAEAVATPRVVVNDDGTVTRKRGRPPAGVKSVYDQVRDLYLAAADRSKEAMLPVLQSSLNLGAGTAQTYWYKAKKEIGEKATATA